MALVVGTLPLIRSSALTYSGTLGYLVGSIHRAIPSRPPVFIVQSRARRTQLAAWTPSVAAGQDVFHGFESLLSALPQLYMDPASRLHYAQYLAQSPTDDAHPVIVPQEQSTQHYHQLLCASVLTDAYLFLTEGVLAR
ncbi:hypothetical protein D915_007561 [Fasciola hepatica]|uniref:Uncharacterized protein n=1 Tax=Fasciola hepatica TaxID=6192 RepID=A0A4E0R7M6_FASHE|nr:hypothetical protein D915_007561 [Fasciola hepatica]